MQLLDSREPINARAKRFYALIKKKINTIIAMERLEHKRPWLSQFTLQPPSARPRTMVSGGEPRALQRTD